jgi:uncharacterized phosphosugar-binding protein
MIGEAISAICTYFTLTCISKRSVSGYNPPARGIPLSQSSTLAGISGFFEAIQELQTRVINSQSELLSTVATHMAAVIEQEKRVFVFGTGHSHMLSEEGFYRAGGLAAVTPIFVPALMLHENPGFSSKLERTPGFARIILERYEPRAGEILFVFSNSGVNQLPVEMALEARHKGLEVIAVCSLAYARVAPLSSVGQRLYEVADFTIDNGGLPGDGLLNIPDSDWLVGPSSTILNALIWNCLVVETVQKLHASGVDLPLIASLNMPGAAEHNEQLFAKWRKINPAL